MSEEKQINAEVVSVFPDRVRIQVHDLEDFRLPEERLAVGSYLRISDSDDCAIIAVIENYSIEKADGVGDRTYLIDALPIGFVDADNVFRRGGNNIAIPPTGVQPASRDEIESIFAGTDDDKTAAFSFASLAADANVRMPVNGNKFFNKHFAVVGATGSGKSHALARILQSACSAREGEFTGLNNSHIVLFDIHGEYRAAFPDANHLDVGNMRLPYWLMNGEELEELLVDHGEGQAYNQASLLRRIVTANKRLKSGNDRIVFDTPAPFSIREVLSCLDNLSRETVHKQNPRVIRIAGGEKEVESDEERFREFFKTKHKFDAFGQKKEDAKKGTFNDGTLDKFIGRINRKVQDQNLEFLLGQDCEQLDFVRVLSDLLGYREQDSDRANVTVIDLSGVPFEVVSITVSLASRLVFENGYWFRRQFEDADTEFPVLIVYEEAHKYVPREASARYRASRSSIERIAKEGRKYGVTLAIVSQRPSEVSETIFSQCNNFVAMRLTNATDQSFVKRLLPDSLGPITDALPILRAGEAVIVGDAVAMPAIARVDLPDSAPRSTDIAYLDEWRKKWLDVDFEKLTEKWARRG